jgi:hypothetical protein
MRSKFKDEHPFGQRNCQSPLSPILLISVVHCSEKRKAEAERIRQKYPDRIPVSSTFIAPT